MAAHEAQAYKDPGTPEEVSRRQFMANATVAVGGVIGLVLTIPLLGSLIPTSLLNGNGGGTWAPLSPDEFKTLQAATETPVKVHISFKAQDGYFTADDEQFAWGIKLSPEKAAAFKTVRPELYSGDTKVDYDPVVMGFVIFSSICPHLGCRYQWVPDATRFICPCHSSQYSFEGKYLAGPAPRGLDPLPFREKDGTAEITWIQYKQQQPSRLIIAYS